MDTKMTLNEEFARIIKQSGSHQNEYTKADSIISLMLAKVDKVKNPYFNRGGYDDTASSVGFNEALQAIKSILEGK